MDIGVGSFVFTQGIVSAIPLLKDPRYLHAPALPKILQVVRKTLPVLTLGLIRVALVKGTDYPVRLFYQRGMPPDSLLYRNTRLNMAGTGTFSLH
jgi:hypothetical protein